MKNTWLYICCISVSLVLTSCNNKETHTDEGTHSEHHELSNDPLVINLNNGEKWKVNPEMMVPVKAMQDMLKQPEPTDLASYQALGAALDTQVSQIISTCTMTGTAHEELHKWLVPYMMHVKSLKGSTTLDEAEMHLNEVHETMAQFDKYFE